MPVLVGGAAAVLLFQPRLRAAVLRQAAARTRPPRGPLVLAGILAVGVYGGYFGAAAGVMLLALLLVALPVSLLQGNAIKNVLLGLSNAVAAVGFAFFAPVDWWAVLPLALGALVGARLGPVVARHLPATALRVGIALAGPRVGGRARRRRLVRRYRGAAAGWPRAGVAVRRSQSSKARWTSRNGGRRCRVVVHRRPQQRQVGRAPGQVGERGAGGRGPQAGDRVGVPAAGRVAGEGVGDRGGELPGVRRGRGALPAGDLRGEEIRRAEHEPGLGHRGVAGLAGDAEVDQVRDAVRVDDHVARLDVAVHHPAASARRRARPPG